jgi:pSer/pThr/pTyr-binding forkhead associated (FHA) protein
VSTAGRSKQPREQDDRSPDQDEAFARLVFETHDGSLARKDLLAPTTLIGTAQGCDLRLMSEVVSRAHCLIWNDGGVLRVRDLRSRAGTTVNGAAVKTAVLCDGDSLGVGPHVFRVETNLRPLVEALPAEDTSLDLSLGRREAELQASQVQQAQELARLAAERAALDAERESLAQRKSREQAACDERAARLTRSEEAMGLRDEQVSRKEAQLTLRERRLAGEQADFDKARAAWDQQQAELSRAAEALAADRAACSTEAETLARGRQALGSDRAALADQRSRLDHRAAELAKADEALADRQRRHAESQARLETAVRELQEGRARLDGVRKELDERAAQLAETLRAMQRERSAGAGEASALARDREALEADRAQHAADRSRLAKERRRLAEEDEALRQAQAEVQKQKAELAGMRAELEEERELVAAARARAAKKARSSETVPSGSTDSLDAADPLAAVSGEEVAAAVVKLGILAADQAKLVAAEANRAGRPLLTLLVERGIVTPYQASRLRASTAERLKLGEFVVLEPMGHGEWTEAFKAQGTKTGQIVVLRRLLPRWRSQPHAKAAFLRRCQTMTAVNGPHAVTCLRVATVGNQVVAVCEHVPGTTLQAVVERWRGLPSSVAVRVARSIALALATAHERGQVHGRLASRHVLIATDGQVKVDGFGRPLAPLPEGTLQGAVAQDARFAAPEVLAGKSADIRADVYSLGRVMLHMLTGRPPRPVRASAASDGDDLEDVEDLIAVFVSSLVAPRPGDRPATPQLVAQTLDQIEPALATAAQRKTAWDDLLASVRAGDDSAGAKTDSAGPA